MSWLDCSAGSQDHYTIIAEIIGLNLVQNLNLFSIGIIFMITAYCDDCPLNFYHVVLIF